MMRKSMRVATAGVLSALSASGLAMKADTARAADLPTKPPLTVHGFNWSGCYLGVNAGWIGDAGRIDTYPGPTFGPGLTPGEVAIATNRHSSNRSGGFTGGGQAGCNWQRAGSPLALGAEADFSGAWLRQSSLTAYPVVVVNPGLDIPTHFEDVRKQVDWLSTIRARLGFVQDRWLLYATGGLAVAQIESSLNWINNGSSIFNGSDSRVRVGWTAGGGLEYAFADNWSAKAEYLYLDFGHYSYDVPHTSVDQAWTMDVRAREHLLRVGLNYRFAGASGRN
jgi:outer membrane immunogenic protein